MESLYSKRLGSIARKHKIVSERLCRKMPLLDSETGVVEQDQEKFQEVELTGNGKQIEQLTKGEEVWDYCWFSCLVGGYKL